jgi:hypothetical protein
VNTNAIIKAGTPFGSTIYCLPLHFGFSANLLARMLR